MKKAILSLVFYSFFLTVVYAQLTPQVFNYSGVARDADNKPIANQSIALQISIRKNSTTGHITYQENHFIATDEYGLFNLIIGAGTKLSGDMDKINWSSDNYYLQLGMDISGGTNFMFMGTTQLLSVPYALHAKTAETLIGGLKESDSIFKASVAAGITIEDLQQWNNKQDKLTAGTGIKIHDNVISSMNNGTSPTTFEQVWEDGSEVQLEPYKFYFINANNVKLKMPLQAQNVVYPGADYIEIYMMQNINNPRTIILEATGLVIGWSDINNETKAVWDFQGSFVGHFQTGYNRIINIGDYWMCGGFTPK
jgi:hypothetical protein